MKGYLLLVCIFVGALLHVIKAQKSCNINEGGYWLTKPRHEFTIDGTKLINEEQVAYRSSQAIWHINYTNILGQDYGPRRYYIELQLRDFHMGELSLTNHQYDNYDWKPIGALICEKSSERCAKEKTRPVIFVEPNSKVGIAINYMPQQLLKVYYFVDGAITGPGMVLPIEFLGNLFLLVSFYRLGSAEVQGCSQKFPKGRLVQMIMVEAGQGVGPGQHEQEFKRLSELATTVNVVSSDILGYWQFSSTDVLCDKSYQEALVPKVDESDGVAFTLHILETEGEADDYLFNFRIVNISRLNIRHDTKTNIWQSYGPMTTTLMAGPEDRMQFEFWVNSFAPKVNAVFIDPENKTLHLKNETCILNLKRRS